ncbi:ABC transporter permease [Spirosoma flavum]|uniref:ABC transporter permease n=1 Tax=Spirosoma flavum TaxID=2048557 RepID=A0ABW6AG27_9BACT
MIRHLITLSWNKKKTHSLLIVEIWASFMVLFGLTSLIIFNVSKYVEPLGFTYENVWAINLANNQDTTEVAQKVRAIFQRLKAYPEVESVSRMSDNSPFSNYHNGMGVSYNKTVTQMSFYVADENLAETLAMPLTLGTWYRAPDSVAKYRPVVINQKASESLFSNANPVGKTISDYEGKKEIWRVAGVINTFKGKGEFAKNEPVMIELLDENATWNKTMLIRVKPGTDAVFEAKMVHDITSMAKGWSVEVGSLVDSRKAQHNITLVPVIIFLVISGFLLINVALGLFGVLNLSIAKRRGEIGLRRALGATGNAISAQFIGEIWVLATFALIIGLLFAAQFPLLNVFDLQAGIYLTAIAISALVIYAIVTLCALFPSRQAAMIQPATALHEE